MSNTILKLAKENGADIGTWDKSGNGANVICFSLKELQKFVDAVIKESKNGH
jgi:hypothetical protein